jgi:CMP-N,N'-diacetyllegionaminic acid synthase
MKFLAVVPARGKSKRIKNKNIKLLDGKPLINWTIEVAIKSGEFTDCLVSTDDEIIASTAIKAGAMVPWLRPSELATDTSRSEHVIAHALNWYESNVAQVDAVVMLQPTSPFRKIKSIKDALKQHVDSNRMGELQTTISVSRTEINPAWMFLESGNELIPAMGWEQFSLRSQELLPSYYLNGSIYILPAVVARFARNIVTPGFRPFVMENNLESIDIDTPADWDKAVNSVSEFLQTNIEN